MKSSVAKHLFYLFVLQAFFTGCNNTPDNKNAPATVKTKTLTDLKNDFKRSNLQAFEVDSFNWESGPDGYTETDSAGFYMIWQDGKRKFKGGGGEDRDYLLSWQSRDSNFIEFTVLTQDESDYCNNITYCIYNKAGKAIDNFVAA